jgi:hypothetical protein
MKTSFLAAALLLAACDGPLLFAELRVPEIRLTLPSQAFPATDAGPQYWCSPEQTTAGCIATEFAYDLGAELPLDEEENVTYHLRLTSMSIALSADQAGTDLAGIDAVTIRVMDPAGGGEGVVVASYTRTEAHPTAISVAGNSSVDLGPYLAAGALAIRVELTYSQATPAFTADVMTSYAFDVTLDYGAML